MHYSDCCNYKICGHLGRHLRFHLHGLTAFFFFAPKHQTLLNKFRNFTHCYTFVILLSTAEFGFFWPYRNISRKSIHRYVPPPSHLIQNICRTMWSVSLSWIQMRVINVAGFCHKRSWTMRHTLILGRRIKLPLCRLFWARVYKLSLHCDLLSGKGCASGGRM